MKKYRGIDVSLWQGYPDFQKIRDAGIDFVMFKASEGTFQDPTFDYNVRRFAQTPGRIYGGSYHFLRAQTLAAAETEADFYISTIRPFRYNLQLWAAIDVEIPSVDVTADRQTFSQIVRLFVDKLRSNGFRPMIYSQYWYINAYFDPTDNVPLWICDITTDTFPAGARVWQYEISHVPGIDGDVDMDIGIDIIGDVNGDGKVNAKDVTAMMKHIVDPKRYPIDESQGDLDRDGKITARDVIALMKIINSK